MIVGYTGPRKGMTPVQKECVDTILFHMRPQEAHHGGCIGGDEEFHELCLALRIWTVIRWGHLPTYRAAIMGTVEYPPTNTIKRNREMVNIIDHLIATPATIGPVPYSGTWATINYARRQQIPITLIFPDGTTVEENQS